ncbi:MAG: PD-(D/E)XK nuclease domain-containing protein, partial [Bacteroidales bacterium]|nr:PD-(D/E)XK nuclease domain-containing protein [Bacteroidales bacterium]
NKPESIPVLKEIASSGFTVSTLSPKFSIDKIHDSKNFPSMLYFLGLLTIDKNEIGQDIMRIPNYSVKTMFWDYISNIIEDANPDYVYNVLKINRAFTALWHHSEPRLFFEYICEDVLSRLSNRDFIKFDEKDLKILILGILFQSSYYFPISEYENSGGYTDIYLKRSNLYPQTKHEWIWELKYIKEKDKCNTSLIEQKRVDAINQLERYRSSAEFKFRTDVRYLSIIFIGDTEFDMVEV